MSGAKVWRLGRLCVFWGLRGGGGRGRLRRGIGGRRGRWASG